MSDASEDPRLEGLARYAVLVARQEAALEAGDVDAFLRHSGDREEVQRRLDALGPLDPLAVADSARLRELVRALERAARADERIRALVRRRQGDTRHELESVASRGRGARRYLRRDALPGPSRAALDLTF